MAPTEFLIEFDDDGNIVLDKPNKAVVRFPTEEEQAMGFTEIPREIRVQEYQERDHHAKQR